MTITIHAPTPEALAEIASRMCAEDVAELAALGHNDVLAALTESVGASREAYVACWNGRPQAAFGIADYEADTEIGVPWLLSTGPRGAIRREFLMVSRRFIASWLPMYHVIFNFVDARHVRAQRWLMFLGFKPLKVHDIGEFPFIEFGLFNNV